MLLEVIYTSWWFISFTQDAGETRAGQIHRVRGLQGNHLQIFVLNRRPYTFLIGPWWLRKELPYSPSSCSQGLRGVRWATTHPFLQLPPPLYQSQWNQAGPVWLLPQTAEMFMNEPFFFPPVLLRKIDIQSHLLIAKEKATIVGWSIAENDNTEMLRLQDLEVI